jgi:hypothetical protein
MRSNGLATILLMIPVLAIPALAIFGIPQFGPIQDLTFGEFRENARESRSGRSTKRSQDDAFSEFEGFNTEADSGNDEPASKQTDSFASDNPSRNRGTRSRREAPVTAWDDESELDQLNQPKRQKSSIPAQNQFDDDDSTNGTPAPKKTAIIDRASRRSKRLPKPSRFDDAVSPASTESIDGSDQKVVQADFDDEGNQDKPKVGTKGKRPRSSEARPAKSRDSTDGPMTWKAAVDRLTELDIRNFRIEPGRDADQFVFICYSPVDAQGVSIRFEAEADEPLKALEKVLEQIVERRQKRQ